MSEVNEYEYDDDYIVEYYREVSLCNRDSDN